jgi:hypothetical protein
MTADFDELVDLEGLGPEEESRLRRVHQMLVAAGPPPDLPGELGKPPADVEGGEVVSIDGARSRRRPVVGILIAAAVAVACFGGGYVLANQAHSSSSIHAVRVVPMSGEQNSFASLRVGSADQSGNWPIQLTVNGLKPLDNEKSRYYLMVFQNGKPVAYCGAFEVNKEGATTVTFNVAYKITPKTSWAVTEMKPGAKFPGHVVMTTS